MTIRVVIADDQALLAGIFQLLIDSADDMEVVGVANDGVQAVELTEATKPDVVLMDIRMPVLDGLAATEQISGSQTLRATRVLILTTFELDEYVAKALRAGASGFLGKDVGPEELLRAIRTIAAGDTLLISSGSEPSGKLLVVADRQVSTIPSWTLSPEERPCPCR
ncbi:response regulator [Nocardia pseudovaccinii]|uniref:response regulator n=1 Tax=Nocardia pseudovaccinii TaxID=189540 RepID=UPI0007A4C209|nr:response regulator transcription factor [Nocardia pseudovaccinii]